MDPVKMLEQSYAATGRVVDAIRPDDLSKPTPCTQWDLRTLLNHVVGVTKYFGSVADGNGDRSLMAAEHLGDDPAADFHAAADATLAAWSKPGKLEASYALFAGEVPGQVPVTIATADAFVHGWDMAKAIGATLDADPALCEALHGFLRGFVSDPARRGDAFAPEVPVPDDAPAIDRLVGFLGRTP
jgi:uncharacterized protein (TIGR03086 family)